MCGPRGCTSARSALTCALDPTELGSPQTFCRGPHERLVVGFCRSLVAVDWLRQARPAGYCRWQRDPFAGLLERCPDNIDLVVGLGCDVVHPEQCSERLDPSLPKQRRLVHQTENNLRMKVVLAGVLARLMSGSRGA